MLLLQEEEEISTMGKISSQAETRVLTNDEQNALTSQRCRERGRMEGTKRLVSKNLDPDFHTSLHRKSRANRLCNLHFVISASLLVKGMQRQER